MKEKKLKKVEVKICGKTEKQIRDAYFNKKMQPLLDSIQASGSYGVKEIEELGAFLGLLKKEREDMIKTVCEKFGGEIIEDNTPPSVEELQKGVSDEVWREKADKAIEYIEKTLNDIRTGISNKASFGANFWSNTSLIFLSYQDLVDKDLVFKQQLYKARLTTIIDKTGLSRKEAEERAELTKEYFNYKSLSKFSKRLEEFYTFARRRDDEVNHK